MEFTIARGREEEVFQPKIGLGGVGIKLEIANVCQAKLKSVCEVLEIINDFDELWENFKLIFLMLLLIYITYTPQKIKVEYNGNDRSHQMYKTNF